MRTILICAAATLALSAGSISAQPGGNGRGDGGGKKGERQGQQAGDKGGGQKGGGDNRGGGPRNQLPPQRQAQGPAKLQGPARPQGPSRPEAPLQRQAQEIARPQRPANQPGPSKQAKPERRVEAPGEQRGKPDKRWNGDADRAVPAVAARPLRGDIRRVRYDGPNGREFFVPRNDRVRIVTDRRDYDWGALHRRADYTGCPPGLARKYNGCTPPGLDRAPQRAWGAPDWYFGDYDRSYRYRYSDGYMLRLGSGTQVLGFIPLLAGALSVGQAWPATYQSVPLPDYYDSYYGLGPADSYRYYDDTIYRVNPGNSTIESVAALLTGNQFDIGQPMPAGYDVYNVPYDYRDQYVDGPDAEYRYSDGYIYQVDPTTRLIQAAIELLA
jgi:hypothetical protein